MGYLRSHREQNFIDNKAISKPDAIIQSIRVCVSNLVSHYFIPCQKGSTATFPSLFFMLSTVQNKKIYASAMAKSPSFSSTAEGAKLSISCRVYSTR